MFHALRIANFHNQAPLLTGLTMRLGKEFSSHRIPLGHQDCFGSENALIALLVYIAVIPKPRRFEDVFVNKIIVLGLVIKARRLAHRRNKHVDCGLRTAEEKALKINKS